MIQRYLFIKYILEKIYFRRTIAYFLNNTFQYSFLIFHGKNYLLIAYIGQHHIINVCD